MSEIESDRPSGDKPFDVSGKELIEAGPQDWLDLTGLPGHVVGMENVNLQTVTSQSDADRVLRVERDTGDPYLVHIELSAAFKDDDALRFAEYNLAYQRRQRIPVQTVVFLLRPKAYRRGQMDGILKLPAPVAGEPPTHTFRYTVIKVWELDPQELLSGGLATVPLAPVANVAIGEVPKVLKQVRERLTEQAPGRLANHLWGITGIMLGLRFTQAEVREQMAGIISDFRDSSIVQIFLEEGEVKGIARGEAESLRRTLLLLGGQRFGTPSETVRTTLESFTIDDLPHLRDLIARLMKVESWNELLPSVVSDSKPDAPSD
jgi:predicted transposase YdaD